MFSAAWRVRAADHGSGQDEGNPPLPPLRKLVMEACLVCHWYIRKTLEVNRQSIKPFKTCGRGSAGTVPLVSELVSYSVVNIVARTRGTQALGYEDCTVNQTLCKSDCAVARIGSDICRERERATGGSSQGRKGSLRLGGTLKWGQFEVE
jgi:hypothetical protein